MTKFRFSIRIKGDILETPGVDWGRPLQIYKRRGDHVVVRRAGHMTWGGVGSREYAPSLYMLLRIEQDGEQWAAVELERHEPGAKWGRTLGLLCSKCERLGYPSETRHP